MFVLHGNVATVLIKVRMYFQLSYFSSNPLLRTTTASITSTNISYPLTLHVQYHFATIVSLLLLPLNSN